MSCNKKYFWCKEPPSGCTCVSFLGYHINSALWPDPMDKVTQIGDEKIVVDNVEEIQVGKWEKYDNHVVKCETWVNSGRRPLLRKFGRHSSANTSPGTHNPTSPLSNTTIGLS